MGKGSSSPPSKSPTQHNPSIPKSSTSRTKYKNLIPSPLRKDPTISNPDF